MADRPLTGKQKKFIDAYLGEAKFNATEAARMAGYRGNGITLGTVGSENIRKPAIANEIRIRLQANAMSADEVLMRLGEHARSDYYPYLNNDGTVDLPRLLADDKGHLIKGVKQTKYGPQIEFYDGQSALTTLAKHHGLLTDKLEIKVADELNSALDLLEKSLDVETYERVLKVLASNS